MPVVTANSNMSSLHAGLNPEIKDSLKVRSLISFSHVVYPGNHGGLQKKMLGEESLGKRRRKNTCSTIRRRDLKGFRPILNGLAF